ncbi:MAG: HK97 family phage prohead protease [Bacteroidales bacterium]|nr:HK97 family phage prohead protease [Bacteroidales bacterium]
MIATKEKENRMSNYADQRFLRTRPEDFKTRDADGNPIIEGYFAVFNSNYELWEGASESIAPTAFDNTLSGDIRALINHDTTLVIGRTTNGTLELKVDSRGLWGRIKINPKDQDAMNIHARVERGDVTQCSFGFYIREEETEYLPDGSIHWTLTDVELFEVSCCTFPAYEETSISARKRDAADLEARKLEAWKAKMTARLTKSNEEESTNGNSNNSAPEENQ